LNEILTVLTPASLATATKANLYEFFRDFGRSSTVDFDQGPRAIRWRTPIPHLWFNGVLSTHAPLRADAASIQDTIAYFRAHGLQNFTWWLEPGLRVNDWAKVLEPQGFAYTEDTPGMAVDLAKLPRSAEHSSQLLLHTVEKLEMLQDWVRTFLLGYELPEEIHAPFYELIASLGLNLPYRYYLAYMYGKPVAASTLFLGAGVAGIYNVATIPEARGQGIGATMTLYPLHQAIALGYRVGVLQSSEMGFRVYQRLGFQTVCQMDHFYWPASPTGQ
jgi:ribosomal protein S18 acetylase RimI-like enzyme